MKYIKETKEKALCKLLGKNSSDLCYILRALQSDFINKKDLISFINTILAENKQMKSTISDNTLKNETKGEKVKKDIKILSKTENFNKKSNNEFLLKKGFYKITFEDSFDKDYIIINLKEDTWTSKLKNFISKKYKYEGYSIKHLDYIIDYREAENESLS